MSIDIGFELQVRKS